MDGLSMNRRSEIKRKLKGKAKLILTWMIKHRTKGRGGAPFFAQRLLHWDGQILNRGIGNGEVTLSLVEIHCLYILLIASVRLLT